MDGDGHARATSGASASAGGFQAVNAITPTPTPTPTQARGTAPDGAQPTLAAAAAAPAPSSATTATAADAGSFSNTTTLSPALASAPAPAPAPAQLAAPEMPPARLARPAADARKSSPSESSLSSAKDATPQETPTYGTRSRNRPGRARPNYAEKEEMDFEPAPIQTMNTPGTLTPSSAQASRSPTVTEHRQAHADTVKKASGSGSSSATAAAATAAGGVWNTVNSLSKDTGIPGTSTFSANPNISMAHPPTRKRKAAQAAAAAAATSAPSSSTNGSPYFSPAPPPQPHNSTARRASTATNAATPRFARETNMLTYEKTKAILKDGALEADDGTRIEINDTIFLICEPPGEPYYLCRVMEFCHDGDNPKAPVDSLRVNWYYRPRDVQRYNNDTRLVYATMHSDICPITSLRGKCRILHRSEIKDLDEFRKTPDSFWYNQCFDRFIIRYYEVIPTSTVINVPQKVKAVLDERWKYVVVEAARAKELTSAAKSCKRCGEYCAADDSVDCALCQNTYHLNCVRPALQKKPSRGFAWACGPCSRAQEKKLEARRTPIIGDTPAEEEEEVFDEEEEEPATGDGTRLPSPNDTDLDPELDHGAQADIAQAKMWPMRYLGMHCRVEDALQYDDRAIYPRACTRLGPRHQTPVEQWYGRPVQLVKPAAGNRRSNKVTGKKGGEKMTKETLAAIEADKQSKLKRPKWVQDEPPGYVARGEDPPATGEGSAKLIFRMPGPDERPAGAGGAKVDDAYVDSYMERARAIAKEFGLEVYHTNWQDKCLQFLTEAEFDVEKALQSLRGIRLRRDLKEPKLNNEDKKKFNEAVAKYGSELRSIRLYVKSQSHADIVRYYYMWKKTAKGREIWGSYGLRKGTKKKVEQATASKALDIADDHDDSAFDMQKAYDRKRGFQCKFCGNRKSRQWRRAPGVTAGQTVNPDGKGGPKDKSAYLVLALCQACASLWRKYAIQWEPQDEVAKKVAQTGGRAYKKRIDEELKRIWEMQNEMAAHGSMDDSGSEATPGFIPPATATSASMTPTEPPRKKQKGMSEPEQYIPPAPVKPVKEKAPPPPPKEPTPPPPIVPSPPKMRPLPCAVCGIMDQHTVSCKDCRLTVHRGCYGIQYEPSNKWACDMCSNDRKELASYEYNCVLCPVYETPQELVEPPKVSHKKKTERDREKERQERDLCAQYTEKYRQDQREKGRPFLPREPLKRTADNNWVHVSCAVWTPEIKFSNAKTLDVVEGIPSIPKARYDQHCKLCKTNKRGACVSCHACHAPFHVACAWSAGYIFGFDVTPVKSSRRDGVNIVTLGPETGTLTAAIWCKDHTVKTIVHPMSELPEPEATINALELFVLNYKQADLTLTGTTRKANLLDEATKAALLVAPPVQPEPTATRRKSAANAATRASRNSSAGLPDGESFTSVKLPIERKCVTCGIDTSPKWWPYDSSAMTNGPVNGIKQESLPLRESVHDIASITNGVSGHTSVPNGHAIDLTKDHSHKNDGHGGAYQCTKCRWNRLHPPEVRERPLTPTPPPLEVVRAPEPPPPVLPPVPHSHWMPTAPSQPPMPSWPPQGQMANGAPHPPQPLPHAPVAPYHPTYSQHQPNNYPPLPSGTTYVPPPQSAPPRSAYSSSVPPPPLSFRESPLGALNNSLPSPRTHLPLQSPTSGLPLPHQREPPYPGPLPHYGQPSHASPPPPPPPLIPSLGTRPETPQDVRTSGASASPSLRNLLH